MTKIKKCLLHIMFSIIFVLSFITPCLANSAEPPSILIIVNNAPEDLTISIGSGVTYTEAKKTNKVIETYYTFYSGHLQKINNNYTMKISTKEKSYDIQFNKPLNSYNNIFTLDLKNQTLTSGKLLSRTIFLVSLRVILTLIIESFVFWIFGFRNKKSWIAFFIINIISQGGLNIWFNGFSPAESYLIFSLIYGEILIFAFETTTFLTFIKEHTKSRIILCVLTANLLSLIVGGYIITILPI